MPEVRVEVCALLARVWLETTPTPRMQFLSLPDMIVRSSVMTRREVDAFLLVQLSSDEPGVHTLRYEFERPNGTTSSLWTATGDCLLWPEQLYPVALAAVGPLPDLSKLSEMEELLFRGEAHELTEHPVSFNGLAEHHVVLPVHLTFIDPGEHRIHTVIDGIRERHAAAAVLHIPDP